MIEWWQHLPAYIDPIVFTVGFFSVHWYALFWLMGFGAALMGARYYRTRLNTGLTDEGTLDLFLILFLGAFLGGHIGYALFYRPDMLLSDPGLFFSPYDWETGRFVGLSGMSFHGGLLGVGIALLWFVRKKRKAFLPLADLVGLVAPLALFFGRLGNFFALELYGRVTTVSWGMYFPGVADEQALRHPSTLYEAFGEGIVLFIILLFVRRFTLFPGQVAAWFLIGYGAIRFSLEYVREPDQGLVLVFGFLTRGQFLSFLLVASGIGWLIWLGRQNRGRMTV